MGSRVKASSAPSSLASAARPAWKSAPITARMGLGTLGAELRAQRCPGTRSSHRGGHQGPKSKPGCGGPRPLHERPTRRSRPRCPHAKRTAPSASTPHLGSPRSSSTTELGIASPASARRAGNVWRCSRTTRCKLVCCGSCGEESARARRLVGAGPGGTPRRQASADTVLEAQDLEENAVPLAKGRRPGGGFRRASHHEHRARAASPRDRSTRVVAQPSCITGRRYERREDPDRANGARALDPAPPLLAGQPLALVLFVTPRAPAEGGRAHRDLASPPPFAGALAPTPCRKRAGSRMRARTGVSGLR
jgi:hypothetical protein